MIRVSIQMMAEVNTKDLSVLEKVRDDMVRRLRRTSPKKVYPRKKSIVLASASARTASSPRHDPNRIAIELSESSAAGLLATLLSESRSYRASHTRTRETGRCELFHNQNPTVGFFIPTSKAERTPVRRFPASAKPGRWLRWPPVEGIEARHSMSHSSRRSKPV